MIYGLHTTHSRAARDVSKDSVQTLTYLCAPKHHRQHGVCSPAIAILLQMPKQFHQCSGDIHACDKIQICVSDQPSETFSICHHSGYCTPKIQGHHWKLGPSCRQMALQRALHPQSDQEEFLISP